MARLSGRHPSVPGPEVDRTPVTSDHNGPEVEYPIRVAAIDTGSNAIRFIVSDFYSASRHERIHYERVPVRLGHQVFLDGRLSVQAMDAASAAFREFRRIMDELSVQHHRAVATSAVREAKNGELLIERVARESNIRLEEITGQEEARLVHLAVLSRIDLSSGKWVLVDLGGGSVEVSVADEMGMLWAQSNTMGSVRLLEVLSDGDDPGRFRRLLAEYVSVLTLPPAASYLTPAGMIATGGNIEALAEITGSLPDADGVSTMHMRDFETALDLLSRLSFDEKIDQLGFREDRADVILPAAMVYHRIATLTGVDRILVPHVGVKEGVLLDVVDDLVNHTTHEEKQLHGVTKAATALGRRFLFDEDHGVHVGDLADSLFLQLQSLHGLGFRERLILRGAALLHDVGLFISYKEHHKHTLYIVANSELPGFGPTEMLMMANVARYHRKRGPRPTHPRYMALSYPDRMRVTQLAGVLRLADALDRQHVGAVAKVDAELEGLSVTLNLTGADDIILEKWAVSRKKDVFEEAFGLKVRVSV